MKEILIFVLVFLFSISYSSSFAHERNVEGEQRMFNAIGEDDFILFKELLEDGVDPIASTAGRGFKTSSFCEATKLGNDKYFELIVLNRQLIHYVSVLGSNYGSPLACAISYDNFHVYQRLLSLGVDINGVQNPGAHDERLYRRPFDIALRTTRADFAWDIIQRIKVNDMQISKLVRFVNGNPGIKGNKKQIYRQKIIQWLIEKGVDINPKSPGPMPKLRK